MAETLLCLMTPDAMGRAQDMLGAGRRVVMADPAKAGEAVTAQRLDRFDLIAHGDGAAAAVALALDHPDAVRSLVLMGPTLIAPDGTCDRAAERLAELKIPCLAMFGTRDATAPLAAARHYRERNAGFNLVFVYDAGHAMAAERPEAVTSLVLDFLERHDLFLVRRESDLIYP